MDLVAIDTRTGGKMKLRNKKTSKVKDVWVQASYVNVSKGITVGAGNILTTNDIHHYDSLAELCKEWEDVPEDPKEYWYIDPMVCGVYCTKIKKDEDLYDFNKQIGNYFETKEEAEKALKKLKALERLRKNGFRFDGFRQDYTRWSSGQDAFRDGKRYIHFNKADDDDWLKENWEDLKLVFKEEE